MKGAYAINPSYSFARAWKPDAPSSADYIPSLEECRLLTQSLVEKLSRCTTYEVLGLSTQVMVLDVSSPLSVAFVAAQETRLGSGVLWDPFHKAFVGVLTSTDHLKILLYCNSHPEATEEVTSWTIGDWLSIRDSPALLDSERPIDIRAVAVRSHPSTFVSCTTRTTLKECLELMRSHDVNRLVVLLENQDSWCTAVAMMDVQQIVEYLGSRFFGKDGSSLQDATTSPLRYPSNTDDGPTSATVDHDESSVSFYSSNRSNLPPAVSSIVSAGSESDILRDVKVGPYHSIFDIPFRCLPMIGVHRHHAIYVTMNNSIAEALKLMLDEKIESIAVCTEDRIITDVISRSDMLRMENQGVYDTNMRLRDALGAKTLRMVYVFSEQDILWDIFSHFVQKRVRELFLVDPSSNELVGQLNIVEFVYFLAFACTN